jgi:hypothetical protein
MEKEALGNGVAGDDMGVAVNGEKKSAYRRKVMNIRDMRILMFCFEQYFLTREQIGQWLMVAYGLKNENAAKVVAIRIVQLLMGNKLIEKFYSSRLGRHAAFRVTKRGIRQLQEEKFIRTEPDVVKIGVENILHDQKVTEIRLAWEAIAQIEDWFPERQLKNGGKEQVPDAVMVAPWKPDGRMVRIGIEVELTQKSRIRYDEKFAEYKKGPYDFVFYFVSGKAIRNAVMELSYFRTDKVYVCLIDDFFKQGVNTLMCITGRHSPGFYIRDRFEPPRPWHKTEMIPIELVSHQGVARDQAAR